MTFIFLLISIFAQLTFAETPSETAQNPSGFAAGINYYESKDFDKAIVEFNKALQQKPTNPSILTNLGLAYFQKNQKGQALARFRKALWLDPDFSPAETALQFALGQLEVKEIPHRIQNYESFRKTFLEPVSGWVYSILGTFLFAFGGWILIRYFAARKKSLDEDLPFPPFPTVGLIFLIAFVAVTTLSILKAVDQKTTRGTIVIQQTKVLAAPDEKSSSLYEIPEGLEVIIQRTQNDWLQVTYPGGMTGWVPAQNVFVTNAL